MKLKTKLNLHWIVCEAVKEAIIKVLEITKNQLGKRHLIIDKSQLKHKDLNEVWDLYDEIIHEWIKHDLKSNGLEDNSRTKKTLTNFKYILFTICDEDGAYYWLIKRAIKIIKNKTVILND
jgi:uncharacterized protein YutD